MAEENTTPDVDLVRDSLEYYDKNTEKYKNILNKITYVKFKESINDHEHNYIYLYDEDKKELFNSRYEYIGLYEPSPRGFGQTSEPSPRGFGQTSEPSNTQHYLSIWTWGWAVPNFNKKNTTIIRKLLMYGTELDPLQNFLKSELITSRFKINNLIQLDIHAAIASYLSKKPIIFKMKKFKNIDIQNNLTNIKYPKYFSRITPETTTNISEISDNPEEQYVEYFLFLLDSDNIK
jgi:hypothetical protein